MDRAIDTQKEAKTVAWVANKAESRSIVCSVGGLVTRAMFDSGADQSLVCPTLLKKQEKDKSLLDHLQKLL